nr:MDR family MFS transporter [Paenibacillus apiarius]
MDGMGEGEKTISNSTFWSIMFAIFFGNFLAVLSTNTINIALPVLMKHFHTDLLTIQWVLTGFMLATGIIAPAVAYFGNRFSTKRLYLVALGGFVICSVLCALSWSESSLIAFRVLQGAFSGIIMPTTMTIVYQVIPKERQALGISLWSLSAMVAPAVGPTLAGWIVHVGDWHWLFWINVPIGLIAMAAVIRFIPMYRISEQTSFDRIGFVSVMLGSLSLLLAFGNGARWGWASWQTLGLIGAGILIIALFVRRSLKMEQPLLDFRVFLHMRYTFSMLLVSILTISLYAGALLTPLFLQNVQGASTLTSGLVLLPASALMAVIIPFTGRWYNRFGPVKLIFAGLLLMGFATYEMSRLHVNTPHGYITFWMAVRNVGIALANTPAMNAGMSAIPRELSGYGSSINSWLRQGLASLSIGLFSSLLAARTITHLAELKGSISDPVLLQNAAYTLSINDINFISVIMTLLGLPLVYFLSRTPNRNHPMELQKSGASASASS